MKELQFYPLALLGNFQRYGVLRLGKFPNKLWYFWLNTCGLRMTNYILNPLLFFFTGGDTCFASCTWFVDCANFFPHKKSLTSLYPL